MKLIFKQRLFSWLDSYDIYDEQGNVVFTVKGALSFGHCLHILDGTGRHVGTVKEKMLTFMPKFELYEGDAYRGCIQKELTFLRPKYRIDFNGWNVSGNMMEWDYEIQDQNGLRGTAHDRYLCFGYWTAGGYAVCCDDGTCY